MSEKEQEELNLGLWNRVCKTNPKHTKKVDVGRKFTAIDAHSQIEAATEKFGPFGIGWGIRNSKFTMLVVDPNDAHFNVLQYTGEIFYKWQGETGVVEIAADIEMFSNGRNGWKPVEDTHKKVRTDALTKGLSYLGFNADVFLGMYDDNKYVQTVQREFAAEGKGTPVLDAKIGIDRGKEKTPDGSSPEKTSELSEKGKAALQTKKRLEKCATFLNEKELLGLKSLIPVNLCGLAEIPLEGDAGFDKITIEGLREFYNLMVGLKAG